MRSMWNSFKESILAFLRYLWHYSGTLAMLSLLVGVLGMGLYHLIVKDVGMSYKEARMLRLYSGLYNTAAPAPPLGIGALSAPGEHGCIHFHYNDAGLPERVVFVDAEGSTATLPGSKVAEQQVVYDEQDRVVAKFNKDATGTPAPDAHGVASREFSYDAQGNLTREVLRDATGKKIVPRMPGYAEKRVTYDAENRPVEELYLDGKGNPITHAAGENTVRYRYDDANGASTRTNYVNGSIRNNADGVAVEKRQKSTDGLVSSHQRYSENGSPVAHSQDEAAAVVVEQSPSRRTSRERRLDADGLPLRHARACAEHVLRHNVNGKPEWECFNGADGLPCVHPKLGFAEHAWEYNDRGELAREYFWDAAGKPAPCYEKRYSGQGDARHVLSLHTDGSTELKLCD